MKLDSELKIFGSGFFCDVARENWSLSPTEKLYGGTVYV
jgi:hypothetical protein